MTDGRIPIAPGFAVDEREFEFSFIRAAGPGGQNVNKVATAAQLRWHAAASPALDEALLARLRRVAGRRMTAAGEIVITARRFRTQEANRRDAIERLCALLRAASVTQRPRRPTGPSKAAKRKRLDDKRKRGEIKKTRRPVAD
jgi:ribosome-associated protein